MKPVEILLVEDDPAQATLFDIMLKTGSLSYHLKVIADGLEAADYLFKKRADESDIAPDIVFLDLNLPGKLGSELLKEIKQAPELRHIPVLILSSSTAEKDIRSCYQSYANCFITKPTEISQFECLMKSVETLWLKRVH